MSYPFGDGPAFARNQWYIAAWSFEIGDKPLARRILGQDVVLFRRPNCDAVALSGACPHRWMPLANAPVIDGTIACPYHGATFDHTGHCVRAPLGQHIRPQLALTAFPLLERRPCVWIWPGDPARADPALIPDVTPIGLDGEQWQKDLVAPYRLAARAQLLIENLFDQAHIEAVHPTTLGAGPDEISIEIAQDERRLAVIRTLPPMAVDERTRGVFDGAGDYVTARLRVELLGAALVNSVGSQTFASDADGEPKQLLGEMNFIHAVTPETPTSTHYFTALTRNFALGDEMLSAVLLDRNERVVAEDMAILEAIEQRIDVLGDVQREVNLASDAGAILARRRIAALIARDGAENIFARRV